MIVRCASGKTARNSLAKRFSEYNNPKFNLPLLGPNDSRESHINHIEKEQQDLRDNLKEYENLKCPDPVPVDVWQWATRPAPVLSPSPSHLPPLPFSGIADWVRHHPGTSIAIGIGVGVVGTAFILGTGGAGALILAGAAAL